MKDDLGGLNRRQFLRQAAVTTATAAWAAPVIQTIAARPAYAGTPVVCDHSACIGACAATGNQATCGGPPGIVCAQACGQFGCGGGGQICSDPAVCDPAGWASCVFIAAGTTTVGGGEVDDDGEVDDGGEVDDDGEVDDGGEVDDDGNGRGHGQTDG